MLNCSKIQAFLFDLDGTLLDTSPDLAATANTLYQRHQLPFQPEALLRPLAGDGIAAFIELGFGPSYATDPTLRQEFIDIYLQQFGQQTIYFPGIENLLLYMAQQAIPWGIVTNKPGFLTEMTLKRFALLSQAKTVISGDSAPRSKPYPDPILLACQQLACQPRACIYIGDHERDIKAGQAAGTYTALAAYGYVSHNAPIHTWHADYIAKDVEQIYQLVSQCHNYI
jgi:phosphoglycolate phosphatase